MSALSEVIGRYQESQEPLRSERRLELVALILLLVVVAQLIWLGIAYLREASVSPVLPTKDSMRVVSPVEAPSITASESLSLQSRPVFWPSRRPVAAPIAESEIITTGTATPARQLQQLQVSGVFGGGDQGGAIVSYKGKRMRLLVGDEIDGWTLLSIAPGEAVFASAGARDVRRLLPRPVAASPVSAQVEVPAADSATAGASSAVNPAAPSNKKNNSAKPPKSVQQGSLSLGG